MEDQFIKVLGAQDTSEFQKAAVVSTFPLQTGTFCSKDCTDHSCVNRGRRISFFCRDDLYVFIGQA